MLLFPNANADVNIRFENLDPSVGKVVFGYVENKAVTNFEENGDFREFYWADTNGGVISTKPYLYEDSIADVNYVSFCVRHDEEVQCSKYECLNTNQTNSTTGQISSNIAFLNIRFIEPDKLAIDHQPISLTELDIVSGTVTFIYTAHIDQKGLVRSSQLLKEVDKTYLEGRIGFVA
ncbi:hypothetical protein [Vibrio coralliirubri]|uniref:hypothetical protein n=1 Tax=Vibrio coralliirubri TaxID=1516159 RepID=UPI000A389486|nr:hypothetical protein [Vibrio coralliirubri]